MNSYSDKWLELPKRDNEIELLRFLTLSTILKYLPPGIGYSQIVSLNIPLGSNCMLRLGILNTEMMEENNEFLTSCFLLFPGVSTLNCFGTMIARAAELKIHPGMSRKPGKSKKLYVSLIKLRYHFNFSVLNSSVGFKIYPPGVSASPGCG